jgi:hypothetical protein
VKQGQACLKFFPLCWWFLPRACALCSNRKTCGTEIEAFNKESEMTRQAIETVDELTNEDAGELEASLSADLALSETASNEIKAGSVVQTGNVYTVTFGGSLMNHNETLAGDEAPPSAPLADLLVEDAEQIKGGLTSSGPSGTGKVMPAVLLGPSY